MNIRPTMGGIQKSGIESAWLVRRVPDPSGASRVATSSRFMLPLTMCDCVLTNGARRISRTDSTGKLKGPNFALPFWYTRMVSPSRDSTRLASRSEMNPVALS